jgi:inorganic pyrophosphatase
MRFRHGNPATQPQVMAHPWHGVPAHSGGSAGTYNAYVELVPADVVKYELDKDSGHLRLDRPQRYSSLCPTPYGFIPQTYCGRHVGRRCAQRTGLARIQGDGDPLDVCVLTECVIAHGGFLATVVPIGGLRMIDADQADDKIIAVLESDLAYGQFRDIADCPEAIVQRLRHYFLAYKQRPGDPAHVVTISEVYDREEALLVIGSAQRDYEESFRPQTTH